MAVTNVNGPQREVFIIGQLRVDRHRTVRQMLHLERTPSIQKIHSSCWYRAILFAPHNSSNLNHRTANDSAIPLLPFDDIDMSRLLTQFGHPSTNKGSQSSVDYVAGHQNPNPPDQPLTS
jgi:hypothetical protein